MNRMQSNVHPAKVPMQDVCRAKSKANTRVPICLRCYGHPHVRHVPLGHTQEPYLHGACVNVGLQACVGVWQRRLLVKGGRSCHGRRRRHCWRECSEAAPCTACTKVLATLLSRQGCLNAFLEFGVPQKAPVWQQWCDAQTTAHSAWPLDVKIYGDFMPLAYVSEDITNV